MEGTPFGRYRLLELLGQGGMGEVWRAYDPAIDRVVALKVLPPNLVGDQVFQERFRREARAAAGLDEPHVVPIFDFGEVEGRLYVTMRLIKGRDLETMLDDGPLNPTRAVGIIEQIALALDAAHLIGLVHRDVKPSNILVADHDFAYLIDFGIARAVGQTGLTGTGATIGTWAYMSPERLNAGQADARADVYALACVLHESLTGQRPFPGDSLEEQIMGHLTNPPPRASMLRTEVPAAMDDVIATGMAKDPAQRYQTTRDLSQAARAALTAPIRPPRAPTVPPSQPPPSPWAPALSRLDPEPPAPQVGQFGQFGWPATQNQPTFSAPPGWGPAPFPNAAPPVQRGNNGGKIALIVGAVIVVAVIAVALSVTLGRSFIGNQGSRSSSQASSPSGAGSPTSSLPSDPTQRLLALVPSDLKCRPGSNPVGGGLAEVDCDASAAGLSTLTYTLFSNQTGLESYIKSGVTGGFQPCPGKGQSPLDWQSGSNPQQLNGTLICYNYDGPVVGWSIDPQLVLGFARGGSVTTIDQVYQWWASRYQ
jgi:serine/threonine protein kinase